MMRLLKIDLNSHSQGQVAESGSIFWFIRQNKMDKIYDCQYTDGKKLAQIG